MTMLRTYCSLIATALLATACPGRDATPDAADVVADAVDATEVDTAPPLPAQITVFAPGSVREGLASYAELTPETRVAVVASETPAADVEAGRGDGLRVAAVLDEAGCVECYRLERTAGGAVVHADGVLGAQYGLSHLLEGMGYRFFHPQRARVPASLALPPATDAVLYGRRYVPEQRVRGLQLHTLHPIEALAFWNPGEVNLRNAQRIIDWMVRNRGNYIQPVGLDNIIYSASGAEMWRPHAAAILAYAHARGVKLGVNIQLFGTGNLQRSFDLLERPDDPEARARIRERLVILMDGVPWDQINLSFGEFSGVAPELFISRVNLARELIRELAPSVEVSASIHVGNYPDLRITYNGESLLYYFLVRYADPSIVPWIHTTMYYNLFEDAGRAYLHDEFDEHRDYLMGRLAAGQRVAYYPESAYWVAFDNSIPMYVPLYMRSRWLDMHTIRERARAAGHAPLDEHVLFTTGWEWGYWQTDAATLRMGFTLPDRWEQPLEEMFAPWGAPGAEVVRQVVRLAEAQHQALIVQRLAAWMAGRDVVIDLGESNMGIVSQPTRPTYAAIRAMSAADRATFETNVVGGLEAMATVTESALRAIQASGVDLNDRWMSEIRDGVEVDLHRARFAVATLRAVLAFASDGNDGGQMAVVERELAAARVVVARRHANLHWSNRLELVARRPNPTLYPHGYLFYADNLCYWDRERVQVQNVLTGATTEPPGCFY